MKQEVKLLWQHHYDEPIGKIIDLREDTIGLYRKAKLLTDVQKGKEALALLRSNIVKGLSVGYTPVDCFFDDERKIRVINKLNLWEISIVTFPANEMAKILKSDEN